MGQIYNAVGLHSTLGKTPVRQAEVRVRLTMTKEPDRVCLIPLATPVTKKDHQGIPQIIHHSTMSSAGGVTRRDTIPVIA